MLLLVIWETVMYMKMGKYDAFTRNLGDGNVHENGKVRCFLLVIRETGMYMKMGKYDAFTRNLGDWDVHAGMYMNSER